MPPSGERVSKPEDRIIGDLTKNLSRFEFRCRCGCGFDTVDIELCRNLQDCADHFAITDGIDVSIYIKGGNRCIERNEEVQKQYNPDYVPYSSKSQHTMARAVDFKLYNRTSGDQIDPERVSHYLRQRYPRKFGIGQYDNRTHFDTRTNGPARWDYRSK